MTLYAPKDVAGIVGVTVVTLFHWRRRGVGPDWVRHGALVFYKAGDLRAYIERVGPIPADMTGRERQSFFMKAHRPERAPVPRPVPVPEPEPVTIAELADRLAKVERMLVKIKMDERERRKRRTVRLGSAKVVLTRRHKRKSKGPRKSKKLNLDEVFPY